MSDLKNLGTVYTTDVLVLGAGTAGLMAAHTAKDCGLDVLVLDRHIIKYTGQATKAGHGVCLFAEGDDPERYKEFAIKYNEIGQYLNDQECLDIHAKDMATYLQEAEKYGAIFYHEEDGSIEHHIEFPGKTTSATTIDLDYNTSIIAKAKERGIRLMERVYFTDLLKDGERVVGAVGFDMDTLDFLIFRAKAVIDAGSAFNFCPGAMFMMGADAQIAAYEAGAEFRNAEQSMLCDLALRNSKEFIYGMYHHIYNKDGVNISDIYAPGEQEQLTTALIRGMFKEAREGRAPLYIDFTKFQVGEMTGFNMGQHFPLRAEMDRHIRSRSPFNPKPEVSVDLKFIMQGLRTDGDSKTSLEGLWAPGSISMYGCAYGAWMHGDGVGFATRTGLRAGKSAGAYAQTVGLGEVDEEFIKAVKERIYAPLHRKGGKLPSAIIRELALLITGNIQYTVDRTEESMIECIEKLTEMEKELDDVYVPEGDGHYLGKYNEARCAIMAMKIIQTATLARKETRGPASRADFPERDDKNMLKWVIVTRGEDGEPVSHYERIPFERYKYKPEGWTPDAANA